MNLIRKAFATLQKNVSLSLLAKNAKKKFCFARGVTLIVIIVTLYMKKN